MKHRSKPDFRTGARHELKYTVSAAASEIIRSRLSVLLTPDLHYRDGSYFIRSLYFDDPSFSAYYDKLAGIDERTKLRIRFYNMDASFIVFEKKMKKEGLVLKRSARISEQAAMSAAAAENYEPLSASGDGLLTELYGLMNAEGYRPSVIVDYNRTAWTFPGTDVRITLDMNIRASTSFTELLTDNAFSKPVMPSYAVLELKYGVALPSFIAQALADIPKDREAVSKYTLSRSVCL